MGCDIHWYSETKRDGEWRCDQRVERNEFDDMELDDFPNRHRDYTWFGLLQPDVRTFWTWSFPERIEVPSDLSPEVREEIESWAGDGHSHGHLTRAELKNKLTELKVLAAKHLIEPTEETEALLHHIQRLEQTIANLSSNVPDTDQRIIFFFDN